MNEERKRRLFTSESVTEGHPDKLCDLIADNILDACLKEDENSRVACEVMAGKGKIFITGEITSNAQINIEAIVRKTLSEIGYCNEASGMNCEACDILVNLSKQSEDIAAGVNQSFEAKENVAGVNQSFEAKENVVGGNQSFELKEKAAGVKQLFKTKENASVVNQSFKAKENEEKSENKDINTFFEGAGDQGMMFGYACDETESYMPLPIDLAHKLTKKLSEVRKNGKIQGLMPDGKAQVTVEYELIENVVKGKNGKEFKYLEEKPVRIDTIVLSTQHAEEKELEELRKEVQEKIIQVVVPTELLDENTKYYINPTGRFVVGGPMGDSGLTGRKIIVDTYGGYARHGGGAFSGKDPTKVDRSAAYMARYIAKNLVANGYAKRCEIQISYAIGVAKPVSIHVETFGSSCYSEQELIQVIEQNFDLTPRGMITTLELRKPIYSQTTNYGHFGKPEMTWEKVFQLGTEEI